MQGSSIGANSEIGRAKQAVCERGQKLNEVEDRTEQMASEAKVSPASYYFYIAWLRGKGHIIFILRAG